MGDARMTSKALRRAMQVVAIPAVVTAAAGELVPWSLAEDDGGAGPADLRPLLGQSAASILPVRAEGGRLTAGGRRLRIFGMDVTAGACFPSHENAGIAAARLARSGFNGVRFHFLDATWGRPQLIRYESGSWTNWDDEVQERWEHFMARLKEQGIYWNVNLLVGRRFGVGDGVDPAIQRMKWKAAHAVGFFHRPHEETQMAYARRLLNIVNRHTGIRIADDPALAMVEINNENGLAHTWMGGDLDDLPEPFAGDLRGQWNQWLRARYTNTAALAAAWGARRDAPGAELLRNGDFAAGRGGWVLEQHRGARAEWTPTGGVALVRILDPATGGWSIQFNQPGFELRRGNVYTIRFRASADAPRRILAQVMQAHDPWQNLGWDATVHLDREEKDFEFTFVASADDSRARFGFTEMAQPGAVFRFSRLSLRPGGTVGLADGERLEGGTVALPLRRGGRPPLPAQRADWLMFLRETEQAHWRRMRRCLVEEIGVRAPVVGTIVATSTPRLMGEFELVDNHEYWQHPIWPGRPWDPENWIVRCRTMVDSPHEATVARLAYRRVIGRPHMVSEYNHPAPNPYASEGPLMLSAYAALQDWDALFLYTWAHDDTGFRAGRITGFFDLAQHPTVLAQVPAAAMMFRRGDVAPAARLAALPWSESREVERLTTVGHSWNTVAVRAPDFDLGAALRHRVGLDLAATDPLPEWPPASVGGQTEWRADTGELVWTLVAPSRGVLVIRSRRSKAALGRICGRTVDLGDGVAVTAGPTRLDWAAVSLTLLEGETPARAPARMLLAATAYYENTGMKWKSPAMESVGAQWGTAPALVEVVPLRLTLPVARGTVRALDPRGRPAGEVRTFTDGCVEVGAGNPSLLYEIQALP